jgi:hypothetical protein
MIKIIWQIIRESNVNCNNKIYDWITSCWQVKVSQTSWNQKQRWGKCKVWSLRCSGKLPMSVCSKFPKVWDSAYFSSSRDTSTILSNLENGTATLSRNVLPQATHWRWATFGKVITSDSLRQRPISSHGCSLPS